eukprot:CAMPEP_0119553038 /NCGR_PEP_ID=MMETSP1352-20130426/5891_1 /TAXON_ID=265584 /ORGANISM="Stauroneis constricta, Strain CCMP1120" /LENGTH=508 /DNA_ID=CAMNT_0007599369 /DNA_START=117 /DNA_END=1643 /DNA_ORIENTATION=+
MNPVLKSRTQAAAAAAANSNAEGATTASLYEAQSTASSASGVASSAVPASITTSHAAMSMAAARGGVVKPSFGAFAGHNKMQAPSLSQQLSAREALLAAATMQRNSSAAAFRNQAYLGGASGIAAARANLLLGGNRAAAAAPSASPLSLFGGDFATPVSTHDILRDVYGIATAGTNGLAAAAAQRNAALEMALQRQQQEQQQRMGLERIRAMRQQALALAAEEMVSFAGSPMPAGSLQRQQHAMLLNRAAAAAAANNQFTAMNAALQQQQQPHQQVPARVMSNGSTGLTSSKAGSQQHHQMNVGLQLRNVPNPDATLAALGSSMRKKNSPYIDASSIADAQVAAEGSKGKTSSSSAATTATTKKRRTRGGVTEPFPERLHRMLSEVEEKGDTDIVSWYAHGRAFGVHDPTRFVEEVLPKYFKQSRLSSFQRQLNLYGFTRISTGPDTGGYYHELFLQGRAQLCIHMRRVGVPQGDDRRKLKVGARRQEPDFYSMKPLLQQQQQQQQRS